MNLNIYFLLFLFAFVTSGCATGERFERKPEYTLFDIDAAASYAEYQATTTRKLKNNWDELAREDQQFTDRYKATVGQIVSANSPTDEKAKCNGAHEVERGMLLIHGLYDSPRVMRDLEAYFNRNCFHTRSMLLPGHGTRPASLLKFSYEGWIEAVDVAMRQFKQDFHGDIYITGFSTGAALGLRYAMEHESDVQGLFLFAPALQLPNGAAILANVLSFFGVDWVPTQKLDDTDYVKYESMTVDSVLEVNKLSRNVRQLVQENGRQVDIPVLIVLAQNDYTIDSATTIKYFERGLFGSRADMLIYRPPEEGETCATEFKPCVTAPVQNKAACQCSVLTHADDHGKEYLVADYSHMALTLDWRDRHYGLDGNYKYCTQYFRSEEKENTCKGNTAGTQEVCYGERAMSDGQHYPACVERGLVVRRLTSNPQFDSLTRYLDEFLEEL